jgi:hypothetical protein
VFEKWRHIRVPHRRMLKNKLFSILLALVLVGGKTRRRSERSGDTRRTQAVERIGPKRCCL